jgi:hypothetical protein
MKLLLLRNDDITDYTMYNHTEYALHMIVNGAKVLDAVYRGSKPSIFEEYEAVDVYETVEGNIYIFSKEVDPEFIGFHMVSYYDKEYREVYGRPRYSCCVLDTIEYDYLKAYNVLPVTKNGMYLIMDGDDMYLSPNKTKNQYFVYHINGRYGVFMEGVFTHDVSTPITLK